MVNKKRGSVFLVLVLLSCLLLLSSTTVAEQWEVWPLVTQSIINAGYQGGEGGQVPRTVTCDSIDGSLIFMGIDVGGIYRSKDGGSSWEPTTDGFNSIGCVSMAIDPRNKNRVLALGCNSFPDKHNGLYLSTDMGETWDSVFSAKLAGTDEYRQQQIVFDESSYDPNLGYCTVAYWSRAGEAYAMWGAENTDVHPALYKSTDGGVSWFEVAGASYGDGRVETHPRLGYVYVANSNGFYISTDGGNSFTQTFWGGITGMDVVSSHPENVYISTPDSIYISTNCGYNFSNKYSAGLRGRASGLQVSPINPDKLLVSCNMGEWYDNNLYYSADGGSSFSVSDVDDSFSFFPWSQRISNFAWSPVDENLVYSFGGDFCTKSTDGGRNFVWSYDGVSAICTYSKFAFNVDDPNYVMVTTQDYNSARSIDNGNSWKYLPIYAEWGGMQYGGYCVNERIHFALDTHGSWGGDKYLQITWDDGANYTEKNMIPDGSRTNCYSAPGNSNILFASYLRSTDHGHNWSAMNNCDAVVTHNPIGNKELYGLKGNAVVRSYDSGATWETLINSDPGGPVGDIAYDHYNNKIYIVAKSNSGYSSGSLYEYDVSAASLTNITSRLTKDQFGNIMINSVAVDPVNPSVVYIGCGSNSYQVDNAVQRTTDNGSTWEVITISSRLGVTEYGKSNRHVQCIRVNPKTRYAHIQGGCFGGWKIGPPDSTDPVDPDDNNLKIRGISRAPVIDGSIDAVWSNSITSSIDNVTQGKVSSSSDLSGTWDVLWDSNNLYVMVDVRDDSICNDSSGFWDNDSVEIYLDADNSNQDSYDGINDYQYVLEYGSSSIAETKLGKTSGVIVSQRDKSGGYVMEFAFPWSTLGVNPVKGDLIGIEVAINDDDDGGSRDGKKTWHGTTDKAWRYPYLFGIADLN